MNVIRIPTKFARSIKRLSDKDRLSVFDSLLKIGENEVIKLPDSAAWDLVELIYWEWMNMESRNWTKPSINHISEWLGTNSPSDSGHRVEYNRIEDNRIEQNKEITQSLTVVDDRTELELLLIEFKRSRAKLKKPMTDKAMDLLLKKLSAYSESEQIAMLEEAIEKGWQSVYPPKQENKAGKNVKVMEAIANYNFT